ncbi:hypothetical protein B4119_0348 [Parageobacillus caldoxylosilyticus]|uniref:Uncharacterized protein n=1 Tax=Saccharococcus caldoxylosilyticus TaxID=81408 RepID=A0A150LZL0_9BACL|nr:hypothetical protein B4119_0348 [Parageobacillus caldoxylosilyticus]
MDGVAVLRLSANKASASKRSRTWTQRGMFFGFSLVQFAL